jgi:phosphomannomutase
MAAKFGTSGLRGLATELIGPTAISHTRAFLQHLLAQRRIRRGSAVCVGLDFRASSPALRANVAEAIRLEGMTEAFCGTVPTPALAFVAMQRKAAAIMITGSHIPADRNGLKFYRPDGEIDKKDEKAIVARVKNLKPEKPIAARSAQATVAGFVARNAKAFAGKPLKGLRVGVYQHSTVARDMLMDLLARAGAEPVALGRSQQFIPVDTEAVSAETTQKIAAWCRGGKFDAIVSADGDGDRPLVADEKGQVLRGDLLGLITALHLKAQVVVTPVTSNSGLDQHLPNGTRRSKVGSPFVIAEMMKARKQKRRGIVGEANGGFFTASTFKLGRTRLSPLPTRDCFLPILAVLAAARKARQPLSALAASFALPVARADRLENFPVETAARLMARLTSSPTACAGYFKDFGKVKKRNTKDGLRVTLAGGAVIHLRASGNAPEFRCYVEAQNAQAAEALLTKALAHVARERHS